MRILSIDSGGLRGILPLMALKFIEEKTGRRIGDVFDFIAGTSTGGLIACGLSRPGGPMSVDDLINFYLDAGPRIFRSSRLNKIRGYFRPEFDSRKMKVLLEETFGEMMLSECEMPVMVPAYDKKYHTTIFFKSRTALQWPRRDIRIVDMLMGATAAPGWFNDYKVMWEGIPRVLIDGGVFLNSPAMSAYIEVTKHSEAYKPGPISILSLGTGTASIELSNNPGQLGLIRPISGLMLSGQQMAVNYQLREVLGSDFMRVNTHIPDVFRDLTDHKNLRAWMDIGEKMAQNSDELANFIAEL